MSNCLEVARNSRLCAGAEEYEQRIKALQSKLDAAEAANLGLSVRRDEYDRAIESLVDVQEQRDALQSKLDMSETAVAECHAEIKRLESRLDERNQLLEAIRADLVFRKQIKPSGECVIPLSSGVWQQLEAAVGPDAVVVERSVQPEGWDANGSPVE